MANVLAPFGFTPVRRLDGAAWTANASQYKIASGNTNHLYQGDVVTLLTTGYIDKLTPGTTAIIGVFVGCEYLSTAGSRRVWSNQWPGSDTTVDVIAYVIDDPLVVFLAQTNGASGSAMPLTTVGANVQFVATAGSNLSGISAHSIDESSVANTTTLPFRVVGIPGLSDVVTGVPYLGPPANGYDQTTKYNLVWVAPNNHYFRANVAGI